jgi:proteasome activator subunit 4
LSQVKPIVTDLVADIDQNKQRAAAEIIAGIIGGSKHWSGAAQRRLWEWLQPILELSLGSNVKTDTLTVWSSFLEVGSCATERDPTKAKSKYVLANRDPRRLYPLVDWLVQQALSVDFDSESSFERTRGLR